MSTFQQCRPAGVTDLSRRHAFLEVWASCWKAQTRSCKNSSEWTHRQGPCSAVSRKQIFPCRSLKTDHRSILHRYTKHLSLGQSSAYVSPWLTRSLLPHPIIPVPGLWSAAYLRGRSLSFLGTPSQGQGHRNHICAETWWLSRQKSVSCWR